MKKSMRRFFPLLLFLPLLHTMVAAEAVRHVPTVPQNYTQKGDFRWLVLASRLDGEAAIGLARNYAKQFANIQVALSANGRYAVLVGPEEIKNTAQAKKDLMAKSHVPNDVYYSKGDNFTARAWKPTGGVLTKVAIEDVLKQPLVSEGLTIQVRTESAEGEPEGFKHIIMQGTFDGKLVFEVRSAAVASTIGDVSFVKLDGKIPHAILTTYTGGAHCCMASNIAAYTKSGSWVGVETMPLNGDGYEFEDIDGDGTSEMLSANNAFLYSFGVYAGSTMPARIEKIIDGKLVDVTRHPQYRRFHRQYLANMEDGIDDDTRKTTEYLAGWTAQKILLGEAAEAWQTVRSLTDQTASWDVCSVALQAGVCPEGKSEKKDFFTALQKFLADHGYN